MSNKHGYITLKELKDLLPIKYKNKSSDRLVKYVNRLILNPDYGDEFAEMFVTSITVLSGRVVYTIDQFIDACKFLCLLAMELSVTDAYIRVFPDRWTNKKAAHPDATEHDMRGESARFGHNTLVNKVREQKQLKFHLVNQDVAQRMVAQLEWLAFNARSDVAKVSAATAVLKETRPPETQKVELEVGLGEKTIEIQQQQTLVLKKIALNQQELYKQGYTLDQIQSIQMKENEVIEGEVDE